LIKILNPIQTLREGTKENLLNELQSISTDDLKLIIRKYMPDMTRKMYKCTDSQKLIDYICRRTESLVTKGDVFYTN